MRLLKTSPEGARRPQEAPGGPRNPRRPRRPQKAYRLRKTETLFSPAAAASRLAEMERVDPEGLWTFVEGHTHNKFNGAHCVSRTQGFVIGPHDDSGAPGALETVLFLEADAGGSGGCGNTR